MDAEPYFRAGRSALAVLIVGFVTGCDGAAVGPDRVGSPIVYEPDDRREFFESDPSVRGLIERSMVALMPKGNLEMSASGIQITAPSHAEKAQLCPGEAFGEQPGAAFCSGVLVDWDLVLTAGHCVHVVPFDDLAVVFGYYYREPGGLVLHASDVHEIADISAEQETQSAARPHFDYAWLRLKRPVRPPRAPAAIRSDVSHVQRGARLTFIGTGGGVPMKTDSGGVVADIGEPWRDYLTASTDSAHGASGGGAFDQELALLAFLEGGDADYAQTDEGCNRVIRRAGDSEPKERLSYAQKAVEGLCARVPLASSLCRPDCGDPCVARAPSGEPDSFGCAVPPRRNTAGVGHDLWLLLLVAFSRYHRRHGRHSS